MEEGGHYYTVYVSSLAAGFAEDVAYRQAVLAQMPDEVSWLDAANLHIKACLSQRETDLLNHQRLVPLEWRYVIEYGLHSLPGRQLPATSHRSAYQRQYTSEALLQESPVSLRFGLLLHRLGDTFAHSVMGRETNMYTVSESDKCLLTNYGNSFGHGHDGHSPDYPFLRKDLFFSYLEQLYNILSRKAQEPASRVYRRAGAPRPYHAVRAMFSEVFDRLARRVQLYDHQSRMFAIQAGGVPSPFSMVNNEKKATWLIEELRLASRREMNITLKPYSPEKDEGMTLQEFLRRHPELEKLQVNDQHISDTVRSMMPEGYSTATRGLRESPPPVIPDYMPMIP
ncbi:MAG: hypothetical protein QM664_09010 [Flavihumibacter sp.]